MRSRWRILMLLCLVASMLIPGIASASTAAGAETRAWAFGFAEHARAGVERSLTLELCQGCELGYDQLASDSLLAARAAGGFHKHHTIPREILKLLSPDVAKAVRGKAGAPNRWSIPEDLHKAIRKGPGGGAYNEAFKQRLDALRRDPTAAEVMGIRDDLVKQFGLEMFRPS